MQQPSIISLFSARPDGATSLSLSLGARLAAERRVLVVDLCLERPEVAPLLDLDEAPGLYQLAYQSRLAPVGGAELEAHVQWRDGMAALPGSRLRPEQKDEISERFLDELLAAATARFDHVVIDAGRPRPGLPAAMAGGLLLWVVTPGPLGMAALDRSLAWLEELGCEWKRSSKVVLNRVSEHSWRGMERFIGREYGLEVTGQVPWAAGFWQRVELSHSLRALSVPVPDRRRFLRAYRSEALAVRQALTELVESLLPERGPASRRAVEV